MEGVQHPHRPRQARGQRAGVAAERVERRGVDQVPPGRVAAREPLLHSTSGAARYDVEQLRPRPTGAGHRHDPNDELGVLTAPGSQERRLVHAHRIHPGQAPRVLDQRPPVLADHPPHGEPAHPQRDRDRGDVQTVLPDQPARLRAGPIGQRRPRPHVHARLTPRPDRARRLRAAPQPLEPQQRDRAPAARQIADPDRSAAVRLRGHSAALAPHPRRSRLTACSTSPSTSDTANNTNPGNPSMAVLAPPSPFTWGLLVAS